MTITDTLTAGPKRVLRLQYAAFRFPLQLIEERVVARVLPDEAPARLGYERFLGVLDGTAGRFLDDAAAQRRAEAITERADALEQAARLESNAKQTRESASTRLHDEVSEAADRRRKAEEEERQRVASAERAETEAKRKAEDDARRSAESRKAAADRKAAAERADAANKRKATEQAVANREKVATAPAKAALEDAAKERAEAAKRKADAEHLGDLAQVAAKRND